AVSAVVIQDVLPSGQARRSARDLDPPVAAQARVGRGRRGEIEIDVVGDEQVEPAVTVVVEERASGAPPRARAGESGRARGILERAVAAIAIQAVLAEVADEEIVASVAVVVADTGALSPAARREAGAPGDVFERAIAPVAIEVIGRRLVRAE